MSADDEGWEDDDEDELFSFGIDPTATSAVTQTAAAADFPVESSSAASAIPEAPARERSGSDDSLLDMLDEHTPHGDLDMAIGDEETPSLSKMDDKETQEILDWLDVEHSPIEPSVSSAPTGPPIVTHTVSTNAKTASPVLVETPSMDELAATSAKSVSDLSFANEASASASVPTATNGKDDSNQSHTYQEPKPTIVTLPPPTAPPKPVFTTLQEALESNHSTISDIRELFLRDEMKVSAECRPHLWSRIVCGKTLGDVAVSSVADSFQQWKESDNMHNQIDWIKEESAILGERIVACTGGNLEESRKNLEEVLLFYFQKEAEELHVDPLLPPVACAILCAGLSPSVASVVLSNILPAFMPILALTPTERLESARSLHSHFYLLACYHLPLLVFHLDRYAPGWYWPKNLDSSDIKEESVTQRGRNLEKQGVVPQSWLISHLAGECKGTLMNPMWLLSLWDLILTSSNNSLRFFLSLALLEKHADTLLMLTGDELLKELVRIMEFKEETTPEGFDIAGDEDTSADEAGNWVAEWGQRARSLWEDTPRSVVSRLRRAEDDAVASALIARQRLAEELAQAVMDDEAQLHRETQEKERAVKEEESRLRTNRARLLSYYRKYNPEKESNIDLIVQTYSGKFDVLDAKLAAKYGRGFNPVLKPDPNNVHNKPKGAVNILSTMNQGFNRKKQTVEEAKKRDRDMLNNLGMKSAVTVTVGSTEVLPVLCWTKESSIANAAIAGPEHSALKFYLVDSRPEVTVEEEGRFPTALSMSPEALMDPDRIRHLDDMFESLRGAVHIVVMGEGFAAVPALYGIHPNPKLLQLMSEDESRTSLCALFFLKKGFPFVSVLDGGFAAAHAWLLREGPSRHLHANSVLVDYDGNLSLFGQLEKQHQDQHADAQVRTQRALQNMFESSMASLTMYQRRFENASKDSDIPGQNVQDSIVKFFSRPDADGFHSSPESGESRFKNPFAGKISEETKDPGTSEGNVETRTIMNPFAGIGNKIAEMRKTSDAAKTEDSIQSSVQQAEVGHTDVSTRTTEGGEQSRAGMKNPFAGLGKQVAKLRIEVPKRSTDEAMAASEEKPSDASRFRIPFGGGKRSESETTEEAINFVVGDDASASKTVTDHGNQSVADNPSPATASVRLTSSFSRIAQAANSSLKENLNVQQTHGGPPKANRFAGLGASINKRVEQVNSTLAKVNASVDNATVSTPKLPEVLKKNPFARFNNSGAGNNGDPTKPATAKASRFTGLNVNMTQLRSSAMERVNSMRAQDEGRSKATPFEEEVSFTNDEGATTNEYTTSSTLDLMEDETIQEKIQPKAEIARL